MANASPPLPLGQPTIARMAVASESPDPDDSRPDRIEVDIVAKPCEALGVLDQDALEAALEQMAILLAETVVAHPERALQPTHAGAQVSFRRLQGQVEVIAHHTVRVENPAVLLARLVPRSDRDDTSTSKARITKTLLERRLGSVVLVPSIPIRHLNATRLRVENNISTIGSSRD